ncbi:replication-associated recombination protein A [PVC group bacterium]|nr:replication-associated recombination protein A [PVC group bacterium]
MTQPKHMKPLAARMRPRTLEEFVGQAHILAQDKLLYRLILADKITSLIFFGPPGVGKTTLASIIAEKTKSCFTRVNAVSSSVGELRGIIDLAKYRIENESRRTILFIDELHRFNKAQQDVLMPSIEDGILQFVGATVHNPLFSINAPLLSRSHVFEFVTLTPEEILRIIDHAIQDSSRGLGRYKIHMEPEALKVIAHVSEGDARRALNIVEVGVLSTPPGQDDVILFTKTVAEESSQKKILNYDHDEDGHYDTISAFIKSLRGSDVDAALYWLAKMIEAGEEARFIARRLLIFASEDIGNADPHAIMLAHSAAYAVEYVGLPEARINLSQAVCYLACAPKSNASYQALCRAQRDLQTQRVDEVPLSLRNKHKYGREIPKGQEYKYNHLYPDTFVVQDFRLRHSEYYQPTERGYEKHIKERLDQWRKRKFEKKS